MPNGNEGIYNSAWCKERHMIIDTRLNTVEKRLWGIIILLFGNLAGIFGVLMTLLSQ